MGFLDLHRTGVNKCRGMPKKYFFEDRMHHSILEGFTDSHDTIDLQGVDAIPG